MNKIMNSSSHEVIQYEEKEKENETEHWVAQGFFHGVKIRNDELIEEGSADSTPVGATELFFDILFTTLITRLNEYLFSKEEYESVSWIEYCQYFSAFWFFWLSNTYYASIFGSDDLLHKIFYGIYSLLLALMAVFQKGGWDSEYAPYFALSAALCRGLSCMVYTRCLIHLNQSYMDKISEEETLTSLNERRSLTKMKFFIVRDLVGCLIWFAGFFIDENRGVIFWIASVLDLPFFAFFGIIRPDAVLRPPLRHFVERLDGFVLIVLGFNIDNIAINPAEKHRYLASTEWVYGSVILSFSLIFLVKLLHFDVEVMNEETHAIKISGQRTFLWIMVSGVVAAGISLLAPGLGHLVHKVAGDAFDVLPQGKRLLPFVLGFSAILIGESVLRLLMDFKKAMGEFKGAHCLFWVQIVVQIVCGVVMLMMHFVFDLTEKQILVSAVIIMSVIVFLNLVDEFFEKRFEEKALSHKSAKVSPSNLNPK